MKYLTLAGKFALVLFWFAFLATLSTPLAKPFASLLGLVAALLVLVNLTSLVLFGLQPQGRSPWSARLQLLLFGVFQQLAPVAETGVASEGLPVALSEGQTRAGQTDQQHAD